MYTQKMIVGCCIAMGKIIIELLCVDDVEMLFETFIFDNEVKIILVLQLSLSRSHHFCFLAISL